MRSIVSRLLRWKAPGLLVAALLAALALLGLPGTASVSATSHTYHVPSIARVVGHTFVVAEVSPALLGDRREGSASPSAEGRDACTAPLARNNATNNVPDPAPQFHPDGTPVRDGPAAWVNTMDDAGNVTTHASSPGFHAEVNAQAAQPGAPMSRVWGWRGPTSAPVWREIPICTECQKVIPQSLFPPNVTPTPGGVYGG